MVYLFQDLGCYINHMLRNLKGKILSATEKLKSNKIGQWPNISIGNAFIDIKTQ